MAPVEVSAVWRICLATTDTQERLWQVTWWLYILHAVKDASTIQ